jgi:PadR family transcriptional regulator AphA
VSLQHVILVLLEKKPGTGYDLAQRFKGGIGHFWSASHQQIYQELKKLSGRKLVEFETQAQADRPDRKHYRITSTGRSELKAWLQTSTRPDRLNSALLVKIYAAHLADPAAMLADLERDFAMHRKKLDEYLELEASYLGKPGKPSLKQSLMYLTLRSGIRYEWNFLELLTEARSLLSVKEQPGRPVAASFGARGREAIKNRAFAGPGNQSLE